MIWTFIVKKYCLYKLSFIPHGEITVVNNQNKIENTPHLSKPETEKANIHVMDESIYADIFQYGELGLGRGYVKGKWTTSDLITVLLILCKNMEYFTRELMYAYNPFSISILKKNKDVDKQCIHAHYDLSNAFYETFLDKPFMAYSTGIWDVSTKSLEESITNKIDMIIDKLNIKPEHHILDIGCGWGKIAKYVQKKTNATITAITVSEEQLKYCNADPQENVTYIMEDYRDIIGQYDRIYSIEMLEHVGRYNYLQYLSSIEQSLKSKGKFVLQITISTLEGSPSPNTQSQYILTDIFPGGDIPRISWVMEAISKVPSLRLVDMQFLDGTHFAKTFQAWYDRLKENTTDDRELIRAFEYYFASCIGLYTVNRLASCVFVIEKI
jgi:cyclopropane-fatty-acyl-phospholipid synthase